MLILSFNTGRFCFPENLEINLYQKSYAYCVVGNRSLAEVESLSFLLGPWCALLRCQSYRQCRSELACQNVVAAPLPLPPFSFSKPWLVRALGMGTFTAHTRVAQCTLIVEVTVRTVTYLTFCLCNTGCSRRAPSASATATAFPCHGGAVLLPF